MKSSIIDKTRPLNVKKIRIFFFINKDYKIMIKYINESY